ncbi:MAG: DUF4012 domain-containing protein [Candidatus Nanopelagicaceae bacterium]
MKSRKRQVLYGVLAVVGSVLLILGFFFLRWYPLYSETKNFISLTENSSSVEEIQRSAERLSGNFDVVSSDLKLPIIRWFVRLADLDFASIDREISAVIAGSPQLLGYLYPQQYLVVTQNSAEARGTGGILGALAIVEFDKGNFKVLQANSNVIFPSERRTPIDMPKEFVDLYGYDPGIFQNSNLSPHFPYGAEIWMALWERKYGGRLDGVIAVDPTALSFILKSTGPVKLDDGEVITSKNVVYKTLSEAYKRFEDDNVARKEYLVRMMKAVFAKIERREFEELNFAHQIKRAILANRLLVYSRDVATQKKLAPTKLAGHMSLNPNNEFRAVIKNTDASKLDYYIERSVKIESVECNNESLGRITVTVRNVLESGEGLPAYVLTRADKGKPSDYVKGQHRFELFLYGPSFSSFSGGTRRGSGELGGVGVERNRPVLVTDIDLKPGETEVVSAEFRGGSGKITYVEQPLVRDSSIEIIDLCSASKAG